MVRSKHSQTNGRRTSAARRGRHATASPSVRRRSTGATKGLRVARSNGARSEHEVLVDTSLEPQNSPNIATVWGGGGSRVTASGWRGLLDKARYLFLGHSLRYLAGMICAILCFIALVLPSPYVIETPGPTQDVLGKVDDKEVISVGDVDSHAARGKLLMLTVNTQGAPGGSPTLGVQTLIAWIAPGQYALPTEAIFPLGQTRDQYMKISAMQMSNSQKNATTAALEYAKKHGIDGADTAKISMHVGDIGGPSAGMMYALGVLTKLTPQDETGGKTIAGTGTIDKNGEVGEIGGIQLKMLAAKRDGATYFLAPADNCNEVVGHVPSGLRDVKVSTLDEAYGMLEAIGTGKDADLPHCTATRPGADQRQN
jgi:Lon-like protease